MSSSPFDGLRFVWKNGELVAREEAKISILSHALHYGTAWFEGIRCYSTPRGPAIFRLRDHMERLVESCKIFRAEVPYSVDELCAAAIETIRANELAACYIRPIVYRGLGTLGVNPLRSPIDVAIAVWSWGQYLGDGAQEDGVDICVSSWRRPSPSSFPANAKAAGAYINAALIKMEAISNGFSEGVALDEAGHVSEGSGENVFLVKKDLLVTPPVVSSILPGITRASVLTLADDLSIEVSRERIPRGLLYTCDELFFSGTAVEITPVRSVDRIPVGDGRPGPTTLRLMQEYMGIATGSIEDRHGWLTIVD